MTATSKLNGRDIEYRGNIWVYADTGETINNGDFQPTDISAICDLVFKLIELRNNIVWGQPASSFEYPEDEAVILFDKLMEVYSKYHLVELRCGSHKSTQYKKDSETSGVNGGIGAGR